VLVLLVGWLYLGVVSLEVKLENAGKQENAGKKQNTGKKQNAPQGNLV